MPALTEAQRRKFGDNARCLLHKVVIAPIFVLQGEKSSRFGLDKDTASSGRNRPNRGEGVCWRVSKGLLKVGVWLVWVFFLCLCMLFHLPGACSGQVSLQPFSCSIYNINAGHFYSAYNSTNCSLRH